MLSLRIDVHALLNEVLPNDCLNLTITAKKNLNFPILQLLSP